MIRDTEKHFSECPSHELNKRQPISLRGLPVHSSKEISLSWILSAGVWLYGPNTAEHRWEFLLEVMRKNPVPVFAEQRASRQQNLLSQVYQRQTHGDQFLVVHVSEAAGVGRHVAQDDMSLALGEQFLQLAVRGGVSDIVIGEEVGPVQRWYVEQVDADNCSTWRALI